VKKVLVPLYGDEARVPLELRRMIESWSARARTPAATGSHPPAVNM
jgi:hypothetical protein